jgi:phosphopentomutase
VGHRGDLAAAVGVLQRIDAFLAGLLPGLASDTLLLLTSDHGNLEDLSTGHTRNPVPLIAVGQGAALLAGIVDSITDIAPSVMKMLGKPWGTEIGDEAST